MKKLYLGILIFLFSFFKGQAQHAYIQSNYLFNYSVFNVANSVYNNYSTASLSHRNQWVGLEGAPKTTNLTVDFVFKKLPLAINLLILNDQITVFNNSKIRIGIAYKFKLNHKNFVSLGLAPSINMIQSNYAKLKLNDSDDENFNNNIKSVYVNPAFGAVAKINSFKIGFSIPEILYQKITSNTVISTFDLTNITYLFSVQQSNKINRDWFNENGLMFSTVPSVISTSSFILNTSFIYQKQYGFGFGYRLKESVIVYLKVNVNEYFSIGYSYDYIISKLSNYSNGSHEINFKYNFNIKKNASNPLFF
jgi:type IX secretion system PorP/SprF family membrane protein